MRVSFGLFTLLLIVLFAFDSYAQDKKITELDVAKLENKANGLLGGLAYRQTTTNVSFEGPNSPVKVLGTYTREFSPSDSVHFVQEELVEDRLERIEYFRIGSKKYIKRADGPWIVENIETELNRYQPESVDNSTNVVTTSPQKDADAAKNDRFLVPNSPSRTKDSDDTPTTPTKSVEVKYEPNKMLDNAATYFYKVTTRGQVKSNDRLLVYTMIKRVWINRNGTLAKTEFENSNSLRPWTQLITVVYEYDPKITIEAPIK